MYHTSSQRLYWTFKSEKEMAELRRKNNQEYRKIHGDRLRLDDEQRNKFFLTAEEERVVIRAYEMNLKDFCRRFEPPMPKSVVGTAYNYLKRFYLHNSVMDFHPKEILATCVYLACKTEEFNVSINHFVNNIKGDRRKVMDIVLSYELLLMQRLNYYLTIHNPFRPVEGFLIDIKTRCTLENPDRLRPGIEEFLDKTFLTDACLLFSPSQIALAAVLHAASKEQENLDSYVTESLFYNTRDKLPVLIEAVRKIRFMVKSIVLVPKEQSDFLIKKLDECRNEENDPYSEAYKIRMKKMMEDEDDVELDTSSFSMADQSLANESMRSIDA